METDLDMRVEHSKLILANARNVKTLVDLVEDHTECIRLLKERVEALESREGFQLQ